MKKSERITQYMHSAQQFEASGRMRDAELVYRQIIELNPQAHPAWHALGLLAFNAGNTAFAVQCIEAAIACDGKVALYHRNIGEIYRRMGQREKSSLAGRRAVKLAPADLDAHYNLGLVYTDARDYRKAIECYRRALKLNARHGLSWNNLGSALEQQGDNQAALDAYERAILLNEHHAEAQNNAGAIYSERGHLVEARTAFEAAITANPDFVDAHYNLSSFKKYTRDDIHLSMLESMYSQRQGLSDPARIRYCFALGKALDDIGEYDRAFAAYEEGNRLQHVLLPMDDARADALLDRIITLFNESFFVERQGWHGAEDERRTPIFIVGMPRSGTTLLEQILCSHASVHGAGELGELNEAVGKATGGAVGPHFIDGVTFLSEADVKRLGEDYLQRVWKLSPDSHYITDKMPANFFYLGLIHLALPQAKIIHAMRDPMDSCFSCYSRLFNDTMEFAYDQGTLGRYYVRYMTLMHHWHSVLPHGTILDLRYEELVEDTEKQARRVLEFVGLPWDANCLKFHENTRLVKTASVAQVRMPIYKSSVARWRHFEKHLQPLLSLVRGYRLTNDVPDMPASPEFLKQGFSTEQAMQLASQHQFAGRLAQAEQLLRQILQADPGHAYALHLLGVLAYQAGQSALALDIIAQAIATDDTVALFHCNLAEMSRQQGCLDEAIRHGERAVTLDPSMASAHGNLGIAYFDVKDFDRAEACHQKALALEPQTLQSLNNLGSIARARKDKSGAIAWYSKALAIDPDYLESLSNLGAVLVENDCADAAVAPLERALHLQPDFTEALCNLGLARSKQERFDEAHGLLLRSLQQRPGYPEAKIGMARVLKEQDHPNEAVRLLREVVAHTPEVAEAWCQLGMIEMELDNSEAAEAAYCKALEIDPGMTDAATGLGYLRLQQGQMHEAERLLCEAIDREPDNIEARFHLMLARRVKPGDANLAALEAKLAETDDLSTDKRVSLHYALGKAYDDLKEFDKAFPQFMEGGRLTRARLQYDASAVTARTARIATMVERDFMQSHSGGGDPSTVPVFVLGMPRSGTTLTEQIIASHPDVHGAGELPDLLDIVQRRVDGGKVHSYPDNLAGLSRDTLTAWGADYVAGLRRRAPTAKRVTDKMPANYLALGLIPLMLPNARIIHVRRNPVDTCVSCFTRLFDRHQDATYDLGELGQHYADYARLMNHWRAMMPPDSFMEVQYEDIVADMEGQARRLIEWVGLPWDDACLSFHKTQRNVRTASVTQVRQPIYSSSVERWRHYEKFLGPLLDGLGEFAPQ